MFLQPLTTPKYSLSHSISTPFVLFLLLLHFLNLSSSTKYTPALILTPLSNHFHTCPPYHFPSHSLFLFNVMLPCLHFPGHLLNRLQLKDTFFPTSKQSYRKQDSSVLQNKKHVLRLAVEEGSARNCLIPDLRSVFWKVSRPAKGVCESSSSAKQGSNILPQLIKEND